MRPPAIPEYRTQTIRRRSPALFPNLSEARQCLSQTGLAGHLPIRAKSKPWPDSAQLMLFAECDCRVSLVCDNGSLAAKLMHSEAYRSCHCLAERMLKCTCIAAGLGANPQRLIGIAEQPQYDAVVQPDMNPRVLR